MKHIIALFSAVIISFSSVAQMSNPLHWTAKVEKVAGDEYKIVFTAVIDKGWHTYGMYIQEGGPVKTSFTFEKNADIVLMGKMTESGPKSKEGIDDVFGVKVKVFEEKAVFEQHFKLKKATRIKASVEAMACNDKSCLPPDTKKFEIAAP